MRLVLGIVVLLMLAATGCSTKPPPPDDGTTPAASTDETLVSGLGTILYQDLEGGFYGLVADDGARYDPLNLDEAFHQDSLRVRFRARRRTGVMTIRMWGQPVDILEITRLDNE